MSEEHKLLCVLVPHSLAIVSRLVPAATVCVRQQLPWNLNPRVSTLTVSALGEAGSSGRAPVMQQWTAWDTDISLSQVHSEWGALARHRAASSRPSVPSTYLQSETLAE